MKDGFSLEPAPVHAEAERALAGQLRYGAWPEVLVEEHRERFADRTRYLLRVQLYLGALVAALTLAWDIIVLPDQFSLALGWRLATTVPLTLAGLYLIARHRLHGAKAMAAISVTCLGIIAMHLASYADAEIATRYVMVTTFLLGIACFALPFTPRELRIFALSFVLATTLAAMWPAPLGGVTTALHLSFAVLIGGTSIAIAQSYWEIDARGFLKDLREEATREELRHSNLMLRELAERDPLTGIMNRRGFERLFHERLCTLSARRAAPDGSVSLGRAAVLMIDLDRFKHFNDSHGHQAGDTCLSLVANLLEDILSRADGGFVARYGGEEFIAAMRDRGDCRAQDVAEEIRAMVESMLLPVPVNDEEARPLVTASVGVGISQTISTAIPEADGERIREELIEMADAALYSAKRGGRNRVEIVATEADIRLTA